MRRTEVRRDISDAARSVDARARFRTNLFVTYMRRHFVCFSAMHKGLTDLEMQTGIGEGRI